MEQGDLTGIDVSRSRHQSSESEDTTRVSMCQGLHISDLKVKTRLGNEIPHRTA
jgi:hypothetical protein